MTIIIERDPASGFIARLRGSVLSSNDVELLRSSRVSGIRFDTDAFESPGQSLAWLLEAPNITTLWLTGSVKTPDFRTLEGTAVTRLFVQTARAVPVPTVQLRQFKWIHSETPEIAIGGFVDLERLEHLWVGRFKGDVVALGDGCASLNRLGIQTRSQSARVSWTTAPKSLRSLMAHGVVLTDVQSFAGCQELEDIQVYNGSVRVDRGVLDVSPLSACTRLSMVHLAENLPQCGIPAVLNANTGVTVHVTRDFHDAPVPHPQIHKYSVRVKA